MSVEMQDAAKFDQGVLGENNSVRYIDNEETAAIPESVDKATLTSPEAISEAFIGGQITEQEADDLMQKIWITKTRPRMRRSRPKLICSTPKARSDDRFPLFRTRNSGMV